jgi:hypothetical protein
MRKFPCGRSVNLGKVGLIFMHFEGFTLYLCNSQSVNLWPIENCICGLCSIDPNMRSILQTVHSPGGEGVGGSILWKTADIGLVS